MNLIVSNSKCSGTIDLPASKSDMHRAIIAASLADGESVIHDITLSNDINATIRAVESLGAIIRKIENTLVIKGINNFKNVKSNSIDCNESGSTLRFLIPILSLFEKHFTLKGATSLFSRPLSIYEEIYRNQDLKFELKDNELTIEGKIKPQEYLIKGDVSSQFISGLLFSLPLLEKESKIIIIPPFESESYVNMTLKTLNDFGIIIKRFSRYEFMIPGNQKYKASSYILEKDYSQFAFYAVLGAINNDVTCKGLNKNSIQGDRIILDILKSFNIEYEENRNGITVYKSNEIKGSVINLSDCPDLGPICMVLSLFSITPVRITNIRRLRIKESNRVDTMVENLRKLNARIDVLENEMVIFPSKLKATKDILNPYNDHRVMMSLVVLATKLKGRIIISNPECVKKSYVNFYKDMQSLGLEVGLHD